MLFILATLTEQKKWIQNLAKLYPKDVKYLSKVLTKMKIWHNLKMVTAIEVISNCNYDMYSNVYIL